MAPVATAPVLSTQTLAHPIEYNEETFYKGSVHRMANGALVRENITNSVKLRFTLTWVALTATERTTLATALATMADGTSVSYISPRNVTYTVVIAEDGEPDFKVLAVKAGAEFRYGGTVVLEEV